MTAADLLTALALPPASRVDRRIPKKMLVEHGAPTTADRRLVTEGVVEATWVAALKPGTVGVPAWRDEERDWPEVAVVHVVLKAGARAARIVELVHRAIPYPVVLVAEQGERVGLSLATKRGSLGQADKVVLEGEVVGLWWGDAPGDVPAALFFEALAFDRQSHRSMRDLYQAWVDVVHAALAARLTGVFALPYSAEAAADRRAALAEQASLQATLTDLRAAARREKEVARLVDLNLSIQRASDALAAARARL